ncbi:hypothetical protein [Streptomyces sp. TS71-3]|uniref:hypothetical protein n=1 Tax=Streptomyces sp. TS71-3 TaxID=2733862 RepID=UPI001BB4593D|nr:hypothetical protein [Streptomyces sp. TS71-3]
MTTADVLDEVPELRRAVDAVCGRAPSEARRRQIKAHARELVRALKHPEHPLTVTDALAEVFAAPSLQVYERLALVGDLRDRGAKRPTSEATAMVRSGVMVLLQRRLGLEVHHLRRLAELPRKEPVDTARGERLRASLQTLADHIGRRTKWTLDGGLMTRGYPRWVRMLALAGIVLDTGARVGELCAIRLDDLSPALDEVRIVRRPQNGTPGAPPAVEIHPLRRTTRTALQRWLLVRRLLMTEVTGGADRVWVSVRGNHGGSVPDAERPRYRPPGTPLQPRGAARAYTAAVTHVNAQLAGEPDWDPLPERMEQLRRGVTFPGSRTAPPPDGERAAALRHRLEQAGRRLAALPAVTDDSADPPAPGTVTRAVAAAVPGARDAGATDRAARVEARRVLREAWRLGADHRAQLASLGSAGLPALDTTRAGWQPELLRALDRAAHFTPL